MGNNTGRSGGGCGCSSSLSMTGGWKYTRRASLASKKRLSARMSKKQTKKVKKSKKKGKTGKYKSKRGVKRTGKVRRN